MSTDATKLLFEGFLKKRKDTMKMKWTTYWFRLQNTTLFFYTKKDGSALHLRGLYYIYTVQSVREVKRDEGKRFVFEIIMTNGKRKVLAAETAALRKEWIAHLWRAMHLSNQVDSNLGHTYLEVSERRERGQSSPYSFSDSDSVTGSLGGRPLSAPDTPVHPDTPVRNPHENRSTRSSLSFSLDLNSEESIYQNTRSLFETHNGGESSGCISVAESDETQQGDYDVLPIRNTMYLLNQSSEVDPGQEEEGVYDVPPSTRTARQEYREMRESIYDVPSSLLRKTTEHAVEPHPGGEGLEEGESLLADMMASLGGESACWGTTAAAADSEGPYSSMYF